jgi:hypothetical protein
MDGLVGYDDRFTRDRSRVRFPIRVSFLHAGEYSTRYSIRYIRSDHRKSFQMMNRYETVVYA